MEGAEEGAVEAAVEGAVEGCGRGCGRGCERGVWKGLRKGLWTGLWKGLCKGLGGVGAPVAAAVRASRGGRLRTRAGAGARAGGGGEEGDFCVERIVSEHRHLARWMESRSVEGGVRRSVEELGMRGEEDSGCERRGKHTSEAVAKETERCPERRLRLVRRPSVPVPSAASSGS